MGTCFFLKSPDKNIKNPLPIVSGRDLASKDLKNKINEEIDLNIPIDMVVEDHDFKKAIRKKDTEYSLDSPAKIPISQVKEI